MTKYKIIISEGCTAYYTEVNGKIVECEHEPSRLSEADTVELIDYLCDKIRAAAKSGEISLNSLITVFECNDYEIDENLCISCGEVVSRTIYEL